MKLCPICGSPQVFTLLDTGEFKQVRCRTCDIAYTEPHLTVEQLRPYYEDGYWHQTGQASRKLRSFIAHMEQRFINFQLTLISRPLKRHVPAGKKVLDVGTGSGEFLHILQKSGYDVYGVDPSSGAVEHAQATFGDRVKLGTLEQVAFPGEAFDAITCIHVLEHVQNPDQTIAEIARILKPGGCVLIEVPHLDSLGFRLFGKQWLGLDIPRHQYHFSDKALNNLLKKHQLQIVERSFYSFRVSPASLVVSLFPIFNPLKLRYAENNNAALKFVYLGLILLAVPLARLAAVFKRGETLTLLAVKRPIH